MDLSFITSYFVPVVMAGCLATGYVVKKWIFLLPYEIFYDM